MKLLDHDDVVAALVGGSIYACGGGGFYEHGLEMGHAAISIHKVPLVTLDELNDNDLVATSAAIGAPGGTTDWEMTGRDYIKAAQMLMSQYEGKIVGFMAGQNGKSSSTNGWLPAAALDLVVVDALGDIRAHPSGKFGNMGLTSNHKYQALETASGGKRATDSHIELSVTGNPEKTAEILRFASNLAGGFFASARNPVTVKFLKENAVVGGYSKAIALGKAVLDAQSKGTDAIVEAILKETKGEILVSGKVSKNNVKYTSKGTFDVGNIEVKDQEESIYDLYAANEFMAINHNGKRVASYPDVITVFDAKTIEPLTTSQIREKMDVLIFKIDCSKFPLSAGAFDSANYVEVEEALKINLFKYAEKVGENYENKKNNY